MLALRCSRNAALHTSLEGQHLPLLLGAKLVDGLEAAPNELVVVKTRFSGFNHTNLDLVLR
jgi:nicotinamidase-related amidase